MDLQLYARVLWRFRLIVVAGALVATALAFLSIVRVGSDGLSYREEQLWSSTTRLLITQGGFPWGRAVAAETDTTAQAKALGFATPERFISLAVLYAELVESDQVRSIMRKDGPIPGKVMASPVYTDKQYTLPLVDVIAIGTSPARANAVSARATNAMRRYIRQEQDAYGVPAQNRVEVQVLARPLKAELFQARSKTLAMVIFLTVILATIGLAFILENMRPRIDSLPERAEPLLPAPTAARRSA